MLGDLNPKGKKREVGPAPTIRAMMPLLKRGELAEG
jgi:hypothetical protein